MPSDFAEIFPKVFRKGVRVEWAYRFGLVHTFDHKKVQVAHTTPRALLREGELSLETLLAWLGATEVGWENLPRVMPKRCQVLVGMAYRSLDAPKINGEGELTELINCILTECEEIAFAYVVPSDRVVFRHWLDRLHGGAGAHLPPAELRENVARQIDQLLRPIQEAYGQLVVCDAETRRTDLVGIEFASGESIIGRIWKRGNLRDPRILDWLHSWFPPDFDDEY